MLDENARLEQYYLFDPLANDTYGQAQSYTTSTTTFLYRVVTALRFPSVAWTDTDYSSAVKENSFVIAAVQNKFEKGSTITHKRGYNSIIYYSTVDGTILRAF